MNGRDTQVVEAALARPLAQRAAPFVLPSLVFGLFTAAEGWWPAQYAALYSVKVVLVTLALLRFRGPLAEIRPETKFVIPSAVLGVIVCAVWITVDKLIPYPWLGERAALDPTAEGAPVALASFIAVRFYGLVVLVPVMEEILWRSFLLRFLTSEAFESLQIGEFSRAALALMVVASAISHPEWLVAGLSSLMFALWLAHTRSLFAVIVAHAVTNACLAAWVLTSGDWHYW